MRFSTLAVLAGLIIAGASRVGAQTEASPTPRPTPPAPPFVNVTPDFSAWTISRYGVAGLGGQPADAVLRKLTGVSKPESVTVVTKTGKVRHLLRKLKTGEQEDIWYERGSRIEMESMWKIPMFEGDTSGAQRPVGADFPELSWIAAGNFVGVQQYQGAAYFVFETRVTVGDPVAAKAYGYKLDTTFNRVFINAETRLPLLHQTGDVMQVYALQAAPTAPLEVPQEYQAMFDNFDKRKLNNARKPVAP